VKDGSVRPDEDFAMDWELYGDKQSRVKAITDAAKEADRLILATDPDREGEAISWHVRELLKKRRAAQGGVARDVQRHHQAGGDHGDESAARAGPGSDRRLSGAPRAGLSVRLHAFAGAVAQAARRQVGRARQSVALRLIVEREREIETFKAQEYWSVAARMEHDGTPFVARLVKFEGQARSPVAGRRRRRHGAKAAVEAANFRVEDVDVRPARAILAAVHHVHPATGSRAQAGLFGQPHHARGADAL
jgi:DNA topoisomerase-1